MELLQSPLALVFYLAGLVLTAWGAARRNDIPSFLGGLLWAAGTVCARVDGAGMDGVLAATLAFLLISVPSQRGRAGL